MLDGLDGAHTTLESAVMGRPRMSDREKAIKTAERKQQRADRGLPPVIDGYIDRDLEAYQAQRASEVRAARKLAARLAGQRAGAMAAILRMRGMAAE